MVTLAEPKFQISLKAARINAGYSRLEEVSKDYEDAYGKGITSKTISNYERGVTVPDYDVFANLCELYNAPTDFVKV